MQRYLAKDFDRVVRWDYPRIFSEPTSIVESLASLLDQIQGTISLVAHSFGDWITRSALNTTSHSDFSKLVSVSPVTTAVPLARWTRPISSLLANELSVMADADQAEVAIADHIDIARAVIWTNAEFLVRTETRDDRVIHERTVWASHNSVLFQLNGWRAIREELLRKTAGKPISELAMP